MKELVVFKLDEEAKLPTRNYDTDAGVDLYALESVFIPKGKTVLVRTGITVFIPEGYVGKIENRSSMSLKGLDVGAGVIDHSYNGDCSVVLHNVTNTTEHDFYGQEGVGIAKGQKIAQMLVYKVETPPVREAEMLWKETGRGKSGWGSSGV